MVVCAIYKKLKGGVETGHVDDAYINVKEYDSTETSKQYIKDGSTIMYDIDDFRCDNSKCNEVFDNHEMSELQLMGYGTETLMRIYDTLITVGNIYDDQIESDTKKKLKDLKVKICLILGELNPSDVAVDTDDDVVVDNTPKVEKVIGCMDETATNYNVDVNTKCDGCCTHNVRLKPISYNISFYKPGKFPDGNKFTMKMELDTYSVCVQERVYNTIDDDGYFNGYQDSNDIPLEDLDKDRFLFKEDVGFYSDNPSLGLKSDLRRAITLYMSREARSYKSGTDEIYGCVLAPIYMNGITVEIKDEYGVNHGVIRFGADKPTLRIDANGLNGWLDYRASNTPSGRKLKTADVKIGNGEGGFHSLRCIHWTNPGNFTSKSEFDCNGNSDGWLTITKNVSESKIGLGTLLGRKDKPTIGLGSLLVD